jgi:hypothetical protein
MDARKKELEHLDTEIARLEQQITSECIEIGRRVAALGSQGFRNEELLKYLNSVDSYKRSAEGFSSDIERIRGLSRQIEARTREIEENDRRRAELDRERRARFVELGAAAFARYRTLPQAERDRFRGAFEDLLKIEIQIEKHHEDLKALENEEQGKGFFERLRVKGRKVLVRGEITRSEKAKAACFEQAGGKVADDPEFARVTDGPLRQLCEHSADRRRAGDALSAENDRKLEEIERWRDELKRLGAGENAEAKIRDIEQRIATLDKEQEVMFCWTGQLFIEHDLSREISDHGLTAKFEIVAGLRESIRKKRQQMDRLKAELELEELTRKEKTLRSRRKQIEEEMRVKERQVGVIDIELNMGLRRIQELKRVLTGEAPYVEAPPLPPPPDLYPQPGDPSK